MRSNYSIVEVEADEIEYKNVNVTFYILIYLHYIISHLLTIILYMTHSDDK